MPLETASNISELVPANPDGSDETRQGDDHIRLIKSTLQATFPNIAGAVTGTEAQLNTLIDNVDNYLLRDGSVPLEGDLQANNNRIRGLAGPTANGDAANKAYVDGLIGGLDGTAAALLAAWPVGSIFMTAADVNPADLFGGAWASFGAGRVLVGSGTGNDGNTSQSFTAGSSGGDYNVTLQASQMPRHSHGIFAAETVANNNAGLDSRGQTVQVGNDLGNDFSYQPNRATLSASESTPFFGSTQEAGASSPHNNVQPYIVVNMWRRVS